MKTIKFKSFTSGSCGNCYFLGIFSEDGTCEAGVLIDAGFSPRRLKKELAREGLSFDDFSAMLVTHDHNDHIRVICHCCIAARKCRRRRLIRCTGNTCSRSPIISASCSEDFTGHLTITFFRPLM